MKNITKITFLIILFNFKITAQNTTFDNVGIGTSGPTYGVQIKTNLPGYTGGWARYFSVANSDGTQNYITMGTYGDMTNGSTSFNRSYIGKDWDDTYLDFLSNGNVGIRTKNPQNILQIGEFKNSSNFKIGIPGVYNFEELKLGQYGNGASGLEMISHTNISESFGVRFFSSTDSGLNGLQIQTALPSNSAQNLNYLTRLAIDVNGNIGIGTITPDTKLAVNGTIHTKEVKVDLLAPMVPDYVFTNDYKLKTLQEVENYIKENNHLPEIPSAAEFEKNGLMLAEMNMSLLKKIEELTLYLIETKKENEAMKYRQQQLENRLKKIENK
jgi:hypothetical protein